MAACSTKRNELFNFIPATVSHPHTHMILHLCFFIRICTLAALMMMRSPDINRHGKRIFRIYILIEKNQERPLGTTFRSIKFHRHWEFIFYGGLSHIYFLSTFAVFQRSKALFHYSYSSKNN